MIGLNLSVSLVWVHYNDQKLFNAFFAEKGYSISEILLAAVDIKVWGFKEKSRVGKLWGRLSRWINNRRSLAPLVRSNLFRKLTKYDRHLNKKFCEFNKMMMPQMDKMPKENLPICLKVHFLMEDQTILSDATRITLWLNQINQKLSQKTYNTLKLTDLYSSINFTQTN